MFEHPTPKLIFPKVPVQSLESVRQGKTVENRLERMRDVVLLDELYDDLEDQMELVENLTNLIDKGKLTKGQYVLLVLEWFRADMLNGGFEQTLGNNDWLMNDILECLQVIGADALFQNLDGMLRSVEEDYQSLQNTAGDGRNLEWRKASKIFSTRVQSKMSDTKEGRFLSDFDNWRPKLEVLLLGYIESNLFDFCTEN